MSKHNPDPVLKPNLESETEPVLKFNPESGFKPVPKLNPGETDPVPESLRNGWWGIAESWFHEVL